MHRSVLIAAATAAAVPAIAAATSTARPAHVASAPWLSSAGKIATLGSTVPANGDINPYGIAVVPASVGSERAGDVLISNFNAKSNNQGTGTTIVQMTPAGKRTVFATLKAGHLGGACPGGVGLTTALSILPGGYVVVGSLPTTNGKSATAKAGCLIIVSSAGKAVGTIAGSNIQGPWDMTAASTGSTSTLFVSNALNGGADDGRHVVANSTIVRIRLADHTGTAPTVTGETVIADHIRWRNDPAALVIGPTGVALARNGTLYVNDTLENRIAAVPQAMTRTAPASNAGTTVTKGGHLNQPLGMAIAPDGNILTVNAGDGNAVETTPAGKQVAVRTLDKKTGAGSLFGVAFAGSTLYFVDDGDNTLKRLR